MKRLLLFDAFSLAFRAFYSYPPHLSLPNGQPINAVFGMVSMIFQAIDLYEPDSVCVCFDTKEPTFRDQLYAEYKAHREEAPDEFKTQVPYFYKVLEACGIPTVVCPGYEADDLIGTIAVKAADYDFETLIMTGDQDSFQLVSPKIKVQMNKRGVSELIEYTEAAVKEKLSILPSQVIDYKALKGDASDNIPGVKGVGDKTAVKLLLDYENLDGVYAHLDELKSASLRSKLLQDKEIAYLSQKLATIHLEVPIDLDFDKFNYNPDWPSIVAIFEAYQFRNLVSKYQAKLGETPIESSEMAPGTLVQVIDSVAILKHLLPNLSKGFAIDLETTSEDPMQAKIVGVSISTKVKSAYYIPIMHEPISSAQLDLFAAESEQPKPDRTHPLLAILLPVLEDPSIPKIAHNAKYEIRVFKGAGIELKGLDYDTMVMAHLLFPAERIGLKALALRHLNIKMQSFEEVLADANTAAQVPISILSEYAAADADCTLRLKQYFDERIAKTDDTEYLKLKSLFETIEVPVLAVLVEMESNGVLIDSEYLKGLASIFQKQIQEISADIFEQAGREFNIQSTKQLAALLFDQMGLPTAKKTKSGYSTDSSVLENLALEYPIAKKVLDFRHFSKLLSTYVEALPKLVNPETGFVHSSFNQTITATGRLSSTHPNLQNIPIRTADAASIRKAFVSRFKNGLILSADYSQIELRLLADLSQDPAMIAAFQNDLDIHQATAAMVFKVDYEQVDKAQRERAKAVNFGISYGQSAFALSKQLGITRKEAQAIIDDYYGQFSCIQNFIDETLAFAREHHYVQTMLGRIRPLADISSGRRQAQAFAERIAVNTRVQGTAADIMKLAMIKVHQRMKAEKMKSLMVIQVHDELVFDLVPEELEQLKQVLIEEMEGVLDLSVPLKIDIGTGKNWLEINQ